jgi:Tol biopolymer transport system component
MVTTPDRAGRFHAEWAESGLKDGRIFIWRVKPVSFLINRLIPWYTVPGTQSYYLLDPIEGKYYPVERPNKYPVHKLSVSPSETKVVYMKDLDGNQISYNDCVIAYADFDSANLVVKDEVVISPEDESYVDMYPRWSPDERYIIYSSSRSGKMQQYMYSLDTGETHMVSDPSLGTDMYPCFEDLPK